jgi:hypothetical protein
MKYDWKNLSFIVALAILLLNSFASSQQTVDSEKIDLKKYEVSGQISGLFVNSIDPSDEVFRQFGFPNRAFEDKFLDIGIGGRFTYNVSGKLAFETEANYFPGRLTATELGNAGIPRGNRPLSGGKKTQILAGVKYGIRTEKYGIFGKIRPGVIRFTAYPRLIGLAVVSSPTGGNPEDVLVITQEIPSTFFNIDVGGILEYYPTKRTVLRMDVGDTIVRYNAQKPKDINPSFTRHNLQASIGFGFRF